MDFFEIIANFYLNGWDDLSSLNQAWSSRLRLSASSHLRRSCTRLDSNSFISDFSYNVLSTENLNVTFYFPQEQEHEFNELLKGKFGWQIHSQDPGKVTLNIKNYYLNLPEKNSNRLFTDQTRIRRFELKKFIVDEDYKLFFQGKSLRFHNSTIQLWANYYRLPFEASSLCDNYRIDYRSKFWFTPIRQKKIVSLYLIKFDSALSAWDIIHEISSDYKFNEVINTNDPNSFLLGSDKGMYVVECKKLKHSHISITPRANAESLAPRRARSSIDSLPDAELIRYKIDKSEIINFDLVAEKDFDTPRLSWIVKGVLKNVKKNFLETRL